ncbi:MAG: rubredoxin [Firmicutes bacterium]|nr:rubredoxin [Bacillota bacterium]
MAKWRCTVCGFVFDGDNPPERCPKCGAPAEKFEKVDDEKAGLIERSRLSNYLHQKLFTLLEEVKTVGEQGIVDNLDPGCVKIFTEARENAKTIQQMIKAEIQTHIQKGKWG